MARRGPSFLIFSTEGRARIRFPTLPHFLSLTSKEVYFILMKSVKNDSCLKAAFFLYLTPASASECKLKCGKIPCGFQNVHRSVCAGLSEISLLVNPQGTEAAAVRTLRRGESQEGNFPIVCFQPCTLGKQRGQRCNGDHQCPPVFPARCIPEKAQVVVFSLLRPIPYSRPDNRYLKVEQQQTTELLSSFRVDGNDTLLTRGAGSLRLCIWKIKTLLGPAWVLMASTQAFFFSLRVKEEKFLAWKVVPALPLPPAVSAEGPRSVCGWWTVLSFHLKRGSVELRAYFAKHGCSLSPHALEGEFNPCISDCLN